MLIVLNQPTGMWESILDAFKGAMGSYILAVILLAVIVRVIFSVVDIVNKRFTMKNAQINEKMKPELDAVQKKYGHDKQLLQQKQSEIYKKYQFNMVGSCLPMLVAMILQLVVFLTLWTGLQNVSNYNIANSYENTKLVYYNVLLLNENEDLKNEVETLIDSETPYTLDVNIDFDNSVMTVLLSANDAEVYSEDVVMIARTGQGYINEQIYNVIQTYATEEVNEETGEVITPLSAYEQAIKTLAEEETADFYLNNLESFLWIKNIYKAESPLTSPVFTKDEITNYLNAYYSEDERALEDEHDYEGQIFDYVVSGLNNRDVGVNGYFILVILAVASSFLSIFLSNRLMKGTNPAGGGKMMYFIMPLILGIFTLMYTSLFAIYIIVGQLIMIALSPLNNLIVKKWAAASDKKKEIKKQEAIDVDYRRKDI